MAFGDSITRSSCYVAKLWRLLRESHPGEFVFVGSQPANSCAERGFSGRTEGHNCYIVAEITRSAGSGTRRGCNDGDTFAGDRRDLEAWFAHSAPDVVLWHIGTNDARNGIPTARTLEGYTAALEALRARSPNVIVLLAKLIPSVEKPEIEAFVQSLNRALPAWAARHSTDTSPIVVVDMHTGFETSWLPDGVHPNDGGASWMARVWLNAIESAMTSRAPQK